MPFNSITFIYYFLPACLFCYYLSPNLKIKNLSLLVFSLFFYFWGEGKWLLFLILLIIFGWFSSRFVHRHPKPFFLILSIIIALLPLLYFKYTPHSRYLPLGISFITFQLISYLFDSYHQKIGSNINFFNFTLYLSFFPNIVSGPITRYSQFSPSFTRSHSLQTFNEGIIRFSFGLAKKILLAANLAIISDQIFQFPADRLPILAAWIGVFTYSLQIYLDFSGYTDIAIGLAKMFSINLPENFNHPYQSLSITEFWRRWHISLSSWFRDYLYIPLGGNRCSKIKNSFNLLLVFGLCGLWHGSALVFFVWGIYHGLLLILDKTIDQKRLPSQFRFLITITLISLGWILFRVNSLPHAFLFLQSLLGLNSSVSDISSVFSPRIFLSAPSLFFFFCLSLVVVFNKNSFLEKYNFFRSILAIASLFLSLVYLSETTYNPFIYFRF